MINNGLSVFDLRAKNLLTIHLYSSNSPPFFV